MSERSSDTDATGDVAPKAVGETVEDFTLPGAGADGIDTFSLSDLTGDGALVISFYPFDFSPVCTTLLCAFRDAEWLTLTDGVDVVGISVDSAYSHKRFRDEYNIPFPLLTDRLGTVADAFGVKYDEWEGHPAVCKRALFAVDETHTVRYRWHAEDARSEPTMSELQGTVGWLGGETDD